MAAGGRATAARSASVAGILPDVLADDLDIRFGFEEFAQPLPGERFVIHDQGAHFHSWVVAAGGPRPHDRNWARRRLAQPGAADKDAAMPRRLFALFLKIGELGED